VKPAFFSGWEYYAVDRFFRVCSYSNNSSQVRPCSQWK